MQSAMVDGGSTAIPLAGHGNTIIIICSFILFSLIYLLGLIIYNIYFHSLSTYPGPKSWAATNILWLRAQVNGSYHLQIFNLHEKYGPVVRIAPDELSYISAEAWKNIYGHRRVGELEMAKSSKWYTNASLGESLLIANREDHNRVRRQLSHGFSNRSLKEQEALIKSYVDSMIEKLKKNSHGGETPLDVVSWYNFTTFDIMGDFIFAESFHCLDSEGYHDWVKSVYTSIKAHAYNRAMQHIPGTSRLAKWLTPANLLEKLYYFQRMTRERVQRRLAYKIERPDFLSNILKEKDPTRRMSLEHIEGNSIILVIAGSETTATLMSGATYLLLKNPRTMTKLVEEVRSTFQRDEDITIESASRLRYMHGCIEEAFRIYPPVPVGLGRVVPKGGYVVDGKWVPEGTTLTVTQYAASHSPTNFTDPESYIPERWLDDPNYDSDARDVLQPFSVGPRNCLGKNLAYAEIRLMLTKMLFHFNLELVDPDDMWLRQETYQLWEKGPLMVRCLPVDGGGGV
ncbi:MAG: hypothetical protein M1834_000582 [Cirrosporium novae-zelandiae]|nr:MAG: hypothetical protein M1834_000582 [Cirrosporium novae-zelandiae]